MTLPTTEEEAQALKDTMHEHVRSASGAGLPARDVENISILIDAGEYEVALETLCTQIYEFDVEIDKAERAALEKLGVLLKVPAPYLLGDPWASREA